MRKGCVSLPQAAVSLRAQAQNRMTIQLWKQMLG